MRRPMNRSIWAPAVAVLALAGCPQKKDAATGDKPATGAAVATEVKLCDNHTTVALDSLPKDRAGGQAVADSLMAQWRQQHPDQQWEADVRRSWTVLPPTDNKSLVASGQKDGVVYGRYTERDVLTWSREVERSAMEGARVFHNADELGSTIAVSCDMCHPDAANTHPETYPKFQVQMGRVAHLRDMINWCLEHPVRAKPMAADDPRMRAMEAYIYAQRKGAPLAYGKH
jgi:thiosulfate dehydrogenase